MELNKTICMLMVCLFVILGFSACRQKPVDPPNTANPDIPDTLIPETKVETSKDNKTRVLYEIYGTGGSITGKTLQTLSKNGVTSAVTAISDLGYKFIRWSDGLDTAAREGDTAEEGTTLTIYAVFAQEFLEMPVLNLTTATGADVTSKKDYISGSLSITNCEEEYTRNNLRIQIRGRGNNTWTYDKKSYRFKLDQSDSLFGLGDGKSKQWCLLANVCDQSLLRNYAALQFCRNLTGIAWAPDCISVELYLNGEYRGVYLLCETVKIDEHRVNIREEEENGVDTGYLLQMTANSDEVNRFSVAGYNYDIKNDLSIDSALAGKQLAFISEYVSQCWTAVQSGKQEDISELIDIDSLIDTYIAEEFCKNLDVGYDSFYLYKNKEGKLTFGPLWDFDLAFGNANEHETEYPEGMYVCYNVCENYHSNLWYTTLMDQSWFRKLVHERWKSDTVQNAVSSLAVLITETSENYYKSFCRNFDKWQIFGQVMNREPQQITSLLSYKEHSEYLADWISARGEWLNDFIGSDLYNSDSNAVMNGLRNNDDTKLTVSGGRGSQNDPFLISKESDFQSIHLCLQNGMTFYDVWFRQTCDLDMTKISDFKGSGDDFVFGGIYDGAGYTIRAVLNGQDEALFPYLSGVVMNLRTTGIIKNINQAAGITRSVRVGGAVINCYSEMTLISSKATAGGISASTQNRGWGDSAMPVLVNCVFNGRLKGATQSSPLNCWSQGRTGQFRYLYYNQSIAETTILTTSEYDIPLGSDFFSLASILNQNLSDAAGYVENRGITVGDLCKWHDTEKGPVLNQKS